MAKSPDAFRTISEVAEWLGIQAHVLRFWESKFGPVKPIKRAGGRRYYRPADMVLLGGIKKLLHDDGLTIKGVQKILREQGVSHVSDLSQPVDEMAESIEVEIEDISATVLQFQSKKASAAPKENHVEATEEQDTVDLESAESNKDIAPETTDDQTDSDEQPETASLPSFLSRASADDDASEPAKTSPPAPQPDIPRAQTVDAPDPGPDEAQPYSPGALGQLAGLDYLTAENAKKLAPLAAELRAWVTRINTAQSS